MPSTEKQLAIAYQSATRKEYRLRLRVAKLQAEWRAAVVDKDQVERALLAAEQQRREAGK